MTTFTAGESRTRSLGFIGDWPDSVTPEEAQDALERYVFNGEAKLAKAYPTGWQASKKGGYYKHSANGIVTVKQAKSGKWYICSDQGLVSKNNWFDTAEEAKQKANAFA